MNLFRLLQTIHKLKASVQVLMGDNPERLQKVKRIYLQHADINQDNDALRTNQVRDFLERDEKKLIKNEFKILTFASDQAKNEMLKNSSRGLTDSFKEIQSSNQRKTIGNLWKDTKINRQAACLNNELANLNYPSAQPGNASNLNEMVKRPNLLDEGVLMSLSHVRIRRKNKSIYF